MAVDSAYKHLGTTIGAYYDVTPGVVTKTMRMREESKKLNRKVFRNPAIDTNVKIGLANTVVFSKGAFGTGTWPMLKGRQLSLYSRAYMFTYRAISGSQWWCRTKGSTDLDTVRSLGVPAPKYVLRTARLRLLARMIRTMHPHFCALFCDDEKRRTIVGLQRLG